MRIPMIVALLSWPALARAGPLSCELRGPRGAWSVLARSLRPEFAVTVGVRRVSEQQLEPLRQLGTALTPALMEGEKWSVVCLTSPWV